jgi:hypothetical protein
MHALAKLIPNGNVGKEGWIGRLDGGLAHFPQNIGYCGANHWFGGLAMFAVYGLRCLA